MSLLLHLGLPPERPRLGAFHRLLSPLLSNLVFLLLVVSCVAFVVVGRRWRWRLSS